MENKTIKMIAVFLFAGLSVQLSAMQEDLVQRFRRASVEGNFQEASHLFAQGVTQHFDFRDFSHLLKLVMSEMDFYPERKREYRSIIRLLLENGVNLQPENECGRSAIFLASKIGHKDAVWLMLTVIPKAEREKLLKERAAIIAGELSLIHGRYTLKDTRKFITEKIVEYLVDEQMNRIRNLINMCDSGGNTPSSVAAQDPEIIRLLNIDNPDTYEEIRAEVRNNVKRILFGELTEPNPFKMSELENDRPQPMDIGE